MVGLLVVWSVKCNERTICWFNGVGVLFGLHLTQDDVTDAFASVQLLKHNPFDNNK